MSEISEPGYHELQLGDNVEDPQRGGWGPVVQVGDELMIGWKGWPWESATGFEEVTRGLKTPYRISRSAWDLDVAS